MSSYDDLKTNAFLILTEEIKELNKNIKQLIGALLGGDFKTADKAKPKPPKPFKTEGEHVLCFHKGKEEFTHKYLWGLWFKIEFIDGDKLKDFLRGSDITEKINHQYDPFYTWKEVMKDGFKFKGWFVATDSHEKFNKIDKFVRAEFNANVFYSVEKGESYS